MWFFTLGLLSRWERTDFAKKRLSPLSGKGIEKKKGSKAFPVTPKTIRKRWIHLSRWQLGSDLSVTFSVIQSSVLPWMETHGLSLARGHPVVTKVELTDCVKGH